MAEGETVEIPLEPPGAYLTYLEKIRDMIVTLGIFLVCNLMAVDVTCVFLFPTVSWVCHVPRTEEEVAAGEVFFLRLIFPFQQEVKCYCHS